MLYKMRYILWLAALLGACDVIQDGRHLRFYPKLKIVKKRQKWKMFQDGHVECGIIKHFAAFVIIFGFLHLKKVKSTVF